VKKIKRFDRYKLLSYYNLKNTQIVYESRYSNVPYFTKRFERVAQPTPKEYRI